MYVKIFGVVDRMARDGSMFARRYDGRGEVFIYAGEAERAGLRLEPGSRIAFFVKDDKANGRQLGYGVTLPADAETFSRALRLSDIALNGAS